jgi:glycosyltransferase involved in cell wall biosynthesis
MTQQNSIGPFVSVIMNCYNGDKYLREAIDSVYAQSYENWEIIIFDNGSIDNTAQIADLYDSKLKYHYYEKKVTLAEARQMAFSYSKGEWLAILDQDDLWYPEKLMIQINAIKNSDYILCYAGIHEIEATGKLIRENLPRYKSGEMFEKQLFQWEINNVTPLINSKALKEHNISYEPSITGLEAYNLYMKLMLKGKVCTIQSVLGAWRIYPGTASDKTMKNWAKERFITLNQIKEENLGIEKLYAKAFKEAFSRGDYYSVRYLMNIKDYKRARIIMKRIAFNSKNYFLLYLLSFVPFLWNKVHSSITKKRLSSIILKY